MKLTLETEAVDRFSFEISAGDLAGRRVVYFKVDSVYDDGHEPRMVTISAQEAQDLARCLETAAAHARALP